MPNDYKLAIIIPAYKPTFLHRALQSIADQTCNRFTVYIGDDASPFKLEQVVQPFLNSLNIVYRRFEENLGGKDLVGQWNRCISLTGEEEWIWLFSDDDMMEAHCVEAFYAFIGSNPEEHLVRFKVDMIGENDEPLSISTAPIAEFTGADLFNRKVKLKLTSTVVEYIFRRSFFLSEGGFEQYDLAWGSDDATWIKLAKNRPIPLLEKGRVYWRYSNVNISSAAFGSKDVVRRKVMASIAYLHWAKQFFRTHNMLDATNSFQKVKWLLQPVKSPNGLSFKEKLGICKLIAHQTDLTFARPFGIVYLLYSTLKEKVAG